MLVYKIKKNDIKNTVIMFIVMFFVALFFNGMNILAYDINHIYLSKTLIYLSCFMASNMIWSHQIYHFISMFHINITLFIFGIILSLSLVYLLRTQKTIKIQDWLRRMISHHSTALTTTNKLIENNHDEIQNNTLVYRLAKDIIYNQEREILFMKNLLDNTKY